MNFCFGAYLGVNGSSIRCCGQQELHPECFPITVDENDEFYSDKAINCMDFVRSAPAPQCQIGYFFVNLFLLNFFGFNSIFLLIR